MSCMHPAKTALCLLAVLGLIGCWFVAQFAWEGHPPLALVGPELAFFGLVSAIVLGLAFNAPRLLAIPAALLLFVYGVFGTWAYGFLWVPGFAALLACVFKRPDLRLRPKPAPSAH